MSSFTRDISAAMAEDLAIVIGALVDGSVQVMPGAPLGGPQWIAEVVVDGAARGSATIAFDADAASAVTGAIMGLDGPVPSEALIDTFREVCSQALSALSLKPVARGAALKLGGLTAAAELEPGNEWSVYALASDKLPGPVTVTIWGELQLTEVALPKTPEQAPAPAPGPAQARSAQAPAASAPAAAQASSDRLDVILDIDLPLTVRFGRTQLPLRSLTKIAPGSVIDLGRSPDDPVEILVGNRIVARGEVVIVSGNYGIRILDVVSPRDRVRTLEV
jgi:flagellar motor switch protein FliN/FliY